MEKANKYEIMEILDDLTDEELITIWNDYSYDTVYTMDEFDEICNGLTPSDIALKSFYGDFNPDNEYWSFNGYGNFKSSDYLEDFINTEELAKHIVESEDDYGITELEKYFESLEEGDE